MSKGGSSGGVGDFLGSTLETVGRILAPQTTQGLLNAPLEQQQRSRLLNQGNALDQIIGGLSGNQPAQTIDINGTKTALPPMKMSSQTIPQLPQSQPTGRDISPGAGLSAVPELMVDNTKPPGPIVNGSANATPMTGGFAPGSGMANFIQNKLPTLALQADPETMIKSLQQRAIASQAIDSIPGLSDQQRAILKVSGPEGMKAFVENSAQGFPTVPDNIKALNMYQSVLAANPNDPRLPAMKRDIDKAGGLETDPNKILETQAQTRSANASAANSGLVESHDAFGNPVIINKSTGATTNPAGMKAVGDDDVDATAKMIANYAKAPPSGASAMRPFNLAIMNRVQQINPDYDQRFYNSSNSARTKFASGKEGGLVRSANVATSHLETLDALGQALDNGDMKLANDLKNKLSDQFGGVPIAGYEAAAPLVGDEVAKFVLGGNSALADREKFAAPLSSARSGPSRNAAINSFRGLMVGQLHGLKRQYEAETKAKDFSDKLDPDVAKLLDNPQYAPGTNPNASTPTNHPAAAAAGIPAIADRVKGQVYPTPSGKMQWTGTGWLPAASPDVPVQ